MTHKYHTKLLGLLFVLLFASSATAWYGDYGYRQPIEINTSANLTNYEYLINVTHISKMADSLNDVVFTDENDTLLYIWNATTVTSSHMDLWVNVTLLTHNGTQMYMYYNSTNVSEYNGTNVFIFYGDIDHAPVTSWTNNAQRTWTITDGILTQSDAVGTAPQIYKAFTYPASYVLEARVRPDTQDLEYIILASFNSGTRNVRSGAGGYAGLDSLHSADGGSEHETKTYTAGTWYKIRVEYDGTNMHSFIDDDEIGTGITAGDTRNQIGFEIHATQDYGSMDYLFARSYASTEPTYAFGAEESIRYNTLTETYNTSGLEGTTHTFSLNIDGATSEVFANFTWNGTVYENPTKSNISNNYTFSKSIIMPSITSNTNIEFNWNFKINDSNFTVTTHNFTIYNILLSNCSVTSDGIILQVNSFNESDISTVTTDVSAIFYITIDEDEVIQTATSENSTTHYFCVTPANSSLTLDVDLGYIDINEGTRQREYYLCNLNVSNTTPYNSSIYSLDTSIGTNTELSVINVTSGEEDVVIRVMRWYQIIGAWNTVTMVKTGFDGVTVVDLQHEGPFYKFQLHKNCGYIQEIGKIQITSSSLSPFVIDNDPLMFSYGPYISWECNNTTTHLFCSVSNTQGWDLTPCLDVYNVVANLTSLQTLNNSNCGSPSSSTTVTVEFGNLTNRVINWQLNVTVQGSTIILGQGSLSGPTTNPLDDGTTNWFFFIILFFGIVGMNIKNPNQAVLSAMLVTTLSGVIGLIPLAPSIIVSLIFLGLLIIGEGAK